MVDSDTPPATSLPLLLIATNVAQRDSRSFATIHNTSSLTLGAYRIGEEIPGAGPVVRIKGRYVDFENASSKRVERLPLDATAVAARPTTSAPTDELPRSDRGDMVAELNDGIRKIDDNNYEIDRALVEKIMANPTAIRGARIVPSIKNGKPNGFKLYAIRPSSAFAMIGLQNGDTIHGINGFDLTTPDKALEVYTKVREANSISVSVTRRGKPVTLNYSIR
jgi:general secretion pathway protein C